METHQNQLDTLDQSNLMARVHNGHQTVGAMLSSDTPTEKEMKAACGAAHSIARSLSRLCGAMFSADAQKGVAK